MRKQEDKDLGTGRKKRAPSLSSSYAWRQGRAMCTITIRLQHSTLAALKRLSACKHSSIHAEMEKAALVIIGQHGGGSSPSDDDPMEKVEINLTSPTLRKLRDMEAGGTFSAPCELAKAAEAIVRDFERIQQLHKTLEE